VDNIGLIIILCMKFLGTKDKTDAFECSQYLANCAMDNKAYLEEDNIKKCEKNLGNFKYKEFMKNFKEN
jgi:hypothetical protein